MKSNKHWFGMGGAIEARQMCLAAVVAWVCLCWTQAEADPIFFDGFEGPYSDPLPEALSNLDTNWLNGGISALYGATGALIVREGVGVGGSRGATEQAGGGINPDISHSGLIVVWSGS